MPHSETLAKSVDSDANLIHGNDDGPAGGFQPIGAFLHSKAGILFLQVGILVGTIGIWEWTSKTGQVDPFFFSSPSNIGAKAWDWILTGFIWVHLETTLIEAGLAFVIGGLAGFVVGVALARSALLSAVFSPYIKMLNSLPRPVFAPIFLLWFGLGIWSKVFFGITLVFFIVFFNTFKGIREVNPVQLDNVRMLGASELQMLQKVYIPSALTWIFSSLNVAVGFAIVGAVVGEYLGAAKGIGYVIAQAQGTFDTTGVFSGILILTVVVVFVNAGVDRAERYLLRWQATRN